MAVAWIMRGGAAGAVFLGLFASGPVYAQQPAQGMTTIAAEELDRRSRTPQQAQGGLSESAVRVMTTYAFSLIPDQVPGPDGKQVAVDKSDPNKFVIPNESARQVIRAATRSAYAEVCGMPELSKANFKAMLAQEEAKKAWSREQILMIEALHLFAASYFTGNAKIVEESAGSAEGAETAGAVAKSREAKAPAPPKCPPEQKQKVEKAINAYVASVVTN